MLSLFSDIGRVAKISNSVSIVSCNCAGTGEACRMGRKLGLPSCNHEGEVPVQAELH